MMIDYQDVLELGAEAACFTLSGQLNFNNGVGGLAYCAIFETMMGALYLLGHISGSNMSPHFSAKCVGVALTLGSVVTALTGALPLEQAPGVLILSVCFVNGITQLIMYYKKILSENLRLDLAGKKLGKGAFIIATCLLKNPLQAAVIGGVLAQIVSLHQHITIPLSHSYIKNSLDRPIEVFCIFLTVLTSGLLLPILGYSYSIFDVIVFPVSIWMAGCTGFLIKEAKYFA